MQHNYLDIQFSLPVLFYFIFFPACFKSDHKLESLEDLPKGKRDGKVGKRRNWME